MKICVIRFSSLGDVVLISAMLQKLTDEYPSSEIDLVTDEKYTELFRSDPRLNKIIGYDISNKGIGYLAEFLKGIRKADYDLVIDAQSNPRSLIITLFSGAEKFKRVQKYTVQRRLMVLRHEARTIPHALQRYLTAVSGEQRVDYRTNLHLDDCEFGPIRTVLRNGSGGETIVGIAPGAARATKIWRIEKTQHLALRLIEQHRMFLVFFGTNESSDFVESICKTLPNRHLNLVGKTSFRELALYLKACDAVLSTDSGPMHIAFAVQTPVVALFGPTVPEFGFWPYGEEGVIISSEQPCRPCSLHGSPRCPLGHHRCMEDIGVTAVENAILGVLDRKRMEDGSK